MKGILVRSKRMHENLKRDAQRALPEYTWLPEPDLYWDTTIAHLPLLCLTMMARVPPRMILGRPRQFFNVTPINQIGITVVDLGDIDEGMEAPRSSSLPPTSVKLFEDISRDSRHKSLPCTIEDIWPKTPSSSEESDEEKGDTGSSLGNASDGASSQLVPAAEDSEGSLRSSHVSRA